MTGYLEPPEGTAFDPTALVTACIESGRRSILLDDGATPPGFFDLSSRLAGELLHELGKYGIRLAVVVPDIDRQSESFRALVAEASRGASYCRFFPSRAAAVGWLDGFK